MSEKELFISIGFHLRKLRYNSGHKSAESFAFEHNFNKSTYAGWEVGKNMTVKNLSNILRIHNISFSKFYQLVEA